MGSVCCVAGRDATAFEAANAEILRTTIQYSPSWGIRWDNRGRVAGEDTAATVIVDDVRWNGRLENKSKPFFDPLPKMRILEEDLDANLQMSTLTRESVGTPEERIVSLQMKSSMEKMPAYGGQTLSVLPDLPSSSYLSAYPLPRDSHLTPASSTPSKWSPHVPRSRLLRQGSDSLLCVQNSPSNYSATEGTSAPMFPVSSIKSTQRSHGGAHDGLSVQSSPDRTPSTHKQTRTFNSNSLGSHRFKLAQPLSIMSELNYNELKTCLLCSKGVDINAVVAILVCGHVYHADCLEQMTPEISKYDPPCPLCTLGEKGAMKKMKMLLKHNERMSIKMFEKLLNNGMDTKPKNKKHRNHVINIDSISQAHGSTPRLESSSSLRSSLAKPFLKGHFSFNSKASSSSSENPPVRSRGHLWSKSSK